MKKSNAKSKKRARWCRSKWNRDSRPDLWALWEVFKPGSLLAIPFYLGTKERLRHALDECRRGFALSIEHEQWLNIRARRKGAEDIMFAIGIIPKSDTFAGLVSECKSFLEEIALRGDWKVPKS